MSMSTADVEREALSRLRVRFEAEGYRFLAEPRKTDLPEFLQTQHPDALAIGPSETVVIEAKRHRTKATDLHLTNLAQEISSHPGWRLLVVYAGEDSDDVMHLPPAEKFQVDQAIEEARTLKIQGQNRYAIVAAWSLFEALARRLYAEDTRILSRTLSPAQIVERLAMDGHLDSEEARHLRDLISVRNRSVHGDLKVTIPDADIDFMLDKVEAINNIM